jgi:hypothetical protein
MPIQRKLPNHLRPRPDKVFGDGDPLPLDRNAKARIMAYARSLVRRTEPGLHYGQITAKALDVFNALLWGFHNARSGLCFPSYEAIAEKAGCARSTVAEALRYLERAGLLSWVNRITRIRVECVDLLGRRCWQWKVIRISNAYRFHDPKERQTAHRPPAQRLVRSRVSSKSESQFGTLNQDSNIPYEQQQTARLSLAEIAKRRSTQLQEDWNRRLGQKSAVA